MDKLEIKIGKFDSESDMRCQGMCKGSCSCPTGFCACKKFKYESSRESDIPDPDYFIEYK